MLSDHEITAQLKNRNRNAYNFLYRTYYPVIEKFILSNHGSTEDARDIFQETLIVLTKNISEESFALNASLKTYLYAISRNLWLKVLRDGKKGQTQELREDLFTDLADDSKDSNEKDETVTQWVDALMSKIPVHCKEIINYVYYDNLPVEELAQKMGYSNAHTASNLKYKCLQVMRRVGKSF